MRNPVRIGCLVFACVAVLATEHLRSTGGDPAPGARPAPTLMTQVGHGNTLTAVACSADGRWVLTASFDRTACLWDRESGREVRRFAGPAGIVTAAALSADGRWVLTGGSDSLARLWDRESGKEVRQYRGHAERVASVAFSADGTLVVTGSWDKTARVWDRESGQELRRFEGHADKVVSAVLSRDGRLALTASYDRTARLWERESGREVRRYGGHAGEVASAAFSPDERVVLTASHDKTARLWDRDAATELGRFEGHADRVTGAVFSPDGRWVLTGSWDKSARVWERESRKEVSRCVGHAQMIAAVAFTQDGAQVLTASHDFTARLWDRQSGAFVRAYEGRASAVLSLAVSRDSRWILMANADGVCRLWDRSGGKEVLRFEGHSKAITSAALSPDNRRVLTASDDRSVRLWDRESGKELRRFEGHTDRVASVAFVADGRWVLTGSDDGTARLWDAESAKELRRYQGHGARVTSVAASEDGRWILTGGQDKTARLWDRESAQELQRFTGHTGMVSAVALSADGAWVATGGLDSVAHVWDRASGKALRNLVGHQGWITSVAFSPDGASLLTGSLDNSAYLWSRASDAPVRRYVGHAGGVSCVVFSPQGDLLLTGSADSTTRVWNTASGANLCALISFKNGGWAVVDPQGRYDASGQGKVDGLHWVVGQEVIALEQLQSAYYEPALLARVFRPPGAPPMARLAVPDFQRLGLFPEVAVKPPEGAQGVLHIGLVARGGGIGKVVVKVDGSTVSETKLPAGSQADPSQSQLDIPLGDHPQLAAGRPNKVTVEVYNAEGSLRSRGVELVYTPPGKARTAPPELWGVVVGVAEYASPALRLRYSAKDAQDISNALGSAATSHFGPQRTHLMLLCSCTPDHPPLRKNIMQALAQARAAGPDDIFVLYLAGHGVTHGTPPDYYFLTQEATSLDVSKEEERRDRTLSAAQIEEALSLIPARRRLLIFDTCRAGTASGNLARQNDDPGEQKRVMERVKASLGTYVLAGCAADAVSYEANQYAQGLLTYALLEAMKLSPREAVRDADLLVAFDLLRYAARRVPEIAKGVGGIQEPQLTVPENLIPVELGRLTPAVKKAITLGEDRALFGRPDLQLEDPPVDSLGLNKAVEAALLTASQAREGAPLNYVPETSGVGLIRIRGRYSLEGEALKLSLYVYQETADTPVKLGEFKESGSRSSLADLAARIVAKALTFAKPK